MTPVRFDDPDAGRLSAASTIECKLLRCGVERRVVIIDIDPQHNPLADQFLQHPDISPNVELLVGDSRQPLPGREFGMLYIDGDHSYEGVRADMEAHWKELQPINGRPTFVAFHDVAPRIGHSLPATSTESETDELTMQVRALRQILIDGLNDGNFDSSLRILIENQKENVGESNLLLEFGNLPELKSQSEPSSPDTNGPNRICRELQVCGAAAYHARAGSILVLQKIAELS